MSFCIHWTYCINTCRHTRTHTLTITSSCLSFEIRKGACQDGTLYVCVLSKCVCVTKREREKGRQCALGRLQYQPTPDGGRKINSGRERERERGRESESKGTDIMTRSLRERFYMCAFVCVEVCLWAIQLEKVELISNSIRICIQRTEEALCMCDSVWVYIVLDVSILSVYFKPQKPECNRYS